MEKKKFTLDGKDYFIKKFFYKPDRIRQIKYLRRYLDFEKEYLGDEFSESPYDLIQRVKITEKLATDLNPDASKIDSKEMQSKLVESFLPNQLSNNFYQKQSEAIQLFILENEENPKELCEIYFDNANEIDHNPLEDNKFLEYNNFITELFSFFFFNNFTFNKTSKFV
jgi:hypothetical protein